MTFKRLERADRMKWHPMDIIARPKRREINIDEYPDLLRRQIEELEGKGLWSDFENLVRDEIPQPKLIPPETLHTEGIELDAGVQLEAGVSKAGELPPITLIDNGNRLILDYETGEFREASQSEYEMWELFYRDFPSIKPGTPGEMTLVEGVTPEKIQERQYGIGGDIEAVDAMEAARWQAQQGWDIGQDLAYIQAGQEYQMDMETAIKGLYPDTNYDNFARFVENHPDQFVQDIMDKGRTPETEALLSAIGVSPAEVYGVEPADVPYEKLPGQFTEGEHKEYYESQVRNIRSLYPQPPYTREQMKTDWYKEMRAEETKAWEDYQETLPGFEESFVGQVFEAFDNVFALLGLSTRSMFTDSVGVKAPELGDYYQQLKEGKITRTEYLQKVEQWHGRATEVKEQFRELPLWEQLLWEGPAIIIDMFPSMATLSLRGVTSLQAKMYEILLNKGLDQLIAKMSRGVQPARNPALQRALYRLFKGDRAEVAERATNNWLRRMGKDPNNTKIMKEAVEETMEELETLLLPAVTPGGTAVPGQVKPLAELIKAAEGVPKVTEAVVPETAKAVGKAAEGVPKVTEAVVPETARALAGVEARLKRGLLSAQQISDFRVGTDKVVREGGKTYVVDTEGIRAKIQVQSDILTPDVVANINKLSPEQKTKMLEAVQSTPYLSDEGRAERLALLKEPTPPKVTPEVLVKPLAEKPTPKEVTKEPWEMTREEWIKEGRGNPELHKLIVEEKLKSQTPRTRNVVPPEVLKDYPDLVKPTATAEDITAAVVPETARAVTGVKAELGGEINATLREINATLPEGWRIEIGEIRIKPGMEEVATGKAMVDWLRKVIVVRDANVMRDNAVINEEIAHVRLEELPSETMKAAISEYEVAAKYEPIEIRSQYARREGFGGDYGKYLTDPSNVSPEIASVFRKYFPTKPVPEVLKDYPDLQTKAEVEEVVKEPPIEAMEEYPDITGADDLTISARQAGIDAFMDDASQEDMVASAKTALNAQSEAANLPPPNIPPARVGHIGSGGKNPENALYDMTNRIIHGEDAGRAAVRIWSGTRKRMATEAISWWKKGNETLKNMGLGTTEGINQRLTKEDSYDLFKALHGEGKVPKNLKPVYDDLKKMLDQEASDMLAFDPSFSRVMMAHPDYFPRGWKPPKAEQAGKYKLGAKPGFLKPRVDATFTEMVEAGWEPISWNPYDMAALRRVAGTEYREGCILIDRLKTFGKAINENDAPREGWRVPKVGPAFEGKPYVSTDGKAYMTPKVAVPNRIADILESTYGVEIEFRIAGVNVFGALNAFGAFTKRAKLFGSLFQHCDFLTRDYITTFTPEGIRHGEPLKFPALAAKVTWSALSPTHRANLEARILSGEPLYEDSTITLKMIADSGWELGADEMLIRRDVREQLESIVKETKGWKTFKPIANRLDSIAKFFEAGLFDGVYRESQAYALEHVIVPRLKRLHPTWTDEQIAGSAAEEVNKQFSTLPVWQSALQQPAVRAIARTLIFSSNETESWIRQATSAVKGENKLYWQEYAISTFVSLAIAANAINLISEGEPLPPDRYLPIKLHSPYSHMPWGIAYNDKFLSPRLPWNGRNGQPIYLDIVGQADTYLRWILDPAGALTARYNVLPRAVMNQIQGRDFWGRELENMGERSRQAVNDLFMPIGFGNLVEAGRLMWPVVGNVIPEQEGRIGIVGSLIQATGLNVRSIKTRDMLDKYARESGLKKADGTPVTQWSDLEPAQKKNFGNNTELQEEMGLRGDTAVERKYPGAKAFAILDELDQERITRGDALVSELVSDLIGEERAEGFEFSRSFRDEVTKLKREIANRKSQVDRDFELFKDTGKLPEDLNKRALVEYYNMFDESKRPSGAIDWEFLNQKEEDLRKKWTPEQEAFVDRNTGLTEWGPLMKEYIDNQKVLNDSGYWDEEERDRKAMRYLKPEIEDILTGKFYNYKPISKESEKLGLKWQDVYRQIDTFKEKYNEMSDSDINNIVPPEGISQELWNNMSVKNKKGALLDIYKESLYEINPGFWEDDRKKSAWSTIGDKLNYKHGEIVANEFVEYSRAVKEHGANSWQALLYRYRSTKLNAFGIQEGTFSTDGWHELDTSQVPVWEIKETWNTLIEEREAWKDPDSGPDIFIADDETMIHPETGETVNKRRYTYDKQYKDNPEYRDAMSRMQVYQWGNDTETMLNAHVGYNHVVDEFGGNSPEAYLHRFKHTDYNNFRTNKDIPGMEVLQPLDEKKVPLWELKVQWKEEEDYYDNKIPELFADIKDKDKRNKAIRERRARELSTNEDYRKGRRAIEGLEKGISSKYIEDYVSHYELPTKGYAREHNLIKNIHLANEMRDAGIITEITPANELPDPEYDRLYADNKNRIDELDDMTGDERDSELKKDVNRNLAMVYYKRQAYKEFIPKEHVTEYAEYMYKYGLHSKPDDWPPDDRWWEPYWYLDEHRGLYKAIKESREWEAKDFRNMPPREVWKLYLEYLEEPDYNKKQFRADNRDLDVWGQGAKSWAPIEDWVRRQEEKHGLHGEKPEVPDWKKMIEEWHRAGVR